MVSASCAMAHVVTDWSLTAEIWVQFRSRPRDSITGT